MIISSFASGIMRNGFNPFQDGSFGTWSTQLFNVEDALVGEIKSDLGVLEEFAWSPNFHAPYTPNYLVLPTIL